MLTTTYGTLSTLPMFYIRAKNLEGKIGTRLPLPDRREGSGRRVPIFPEGSSTYERRGGKDEGITTRRGIGRNPDRRGGMTAIPNDEEGNGAKRPEEGGEADRRGTQRRFPTRSEGWRSSRRGGRDFVRYPDEEG